MCIQASFLMYSFLCWKFLDEIPCFKAKFCLICFNWDLSILDSIALHFSHVLIS